MSELHLNLPLDAYWRQATSISDAEPWLLVLMHGVGSNAQDLYSLSPYVPSHFHVLSLQAPYSTGANAFAWFQFSVNPDGTRRISVEQEAHSRALVAQTIRQAAEQLNVPAKKVLVGGFSQGGIMSLSLLLTEPGLLGGIVVWHSRLLPEIAPLHVAPERLQAKLVWLSHGTQDDVIPLTSAHASRTHLQALPVDLTYREYPCTHTIHPQELADCVQWMQQVSSNP